MTRKYVKKNIYVIDRSTIIKEVNDDRDMFIMDYGPIEHCFTSKICVKIKSVADIKSMLNAYNIFHFESYPGYIDDLRFHLKETEKLIPLRIWVGKVYASLNNA